MGWQILSEIAGYLFTGRAVLFVLGLVFGGMLTVASGTVYDWMSVLLGWWNAIVGMVIG